MESSESPDPPGHHGQGAKSQKKMQKMRPCSACIPCRNRKVKCDRLTPCDTCTSRGIPHECKYIANDSDRFQMSQAEKISDLRSLVRDLRNRVVKAEEEEEKRRKAEALLNPNPSKNAGCPAFPGHGDLEVMENLYRVICEADGEQAWKAVGFIREGRDLKDVLRLVGG